MTEKAFSPIGYTMNGKFNRFVILFCLMFDWRLWTENRFRWLTWLANFVHFTDKWHCSDMWLDWVFPNCLHCSVPSGERKGTISSKSIPTPKVSLKHNIQTVYSVFPAPWAGVWINTFACNSVWQFLNMTFGHLPETEILKGVLTFSWKHIKYVSWS